MTKLNAEDINTIWSIVAIRKHREREKRQA
jgi:hypothetical protein